MRLLAIVPVLAITGCGTPESLPLDRSAEPVDFEAVLEPAGGQVIHGWGQLSGAWTKAEPAGRGDMEDLRHYQETLGPSKPAMIAAYVAPVADQVRSFETGLTGLIEREGTAFINLGLYFHSIERQVAAGEHDAEIRQLLRALVRLEVPVLLRIGYEFNNPWARYDPGSYVQAFRRVHGLILEEAGCSIATAWNATALGLQESPPDRWYPGDEFVDWWSFNVFHMEEFSLAELATFLENARDHRKPVLIGEASPVLSSRIPMRVRGPSSADEATSWYQRFFELLRRRPEIKAFSLIAVDFRRIRSQTPGFGWPNTRLDAWPGVATLVRSNLDDPRYLDLEEFRAHIREGRRPTRRCS